MSDKKDVVVTGGCGALGFNLVKKLVMTGDYKVSVIDNFSSGRNSLPVGVSLTYLDIANDEKLIDYFSNYKPHYIFHLAAHFANQNSVDFPVSDVQTNIIGLINLFEAQKTNQNLSKVVFASSSCVYGDSEFMSEGDEIRPYDTPYAINKYAGELYCKYYSEIFKIPTSICRIFNSFGEGELPGRYRNVIPNFVSKALQGDDLVITGDGSETRDFTYVEDTVDLLINLAQSPYRDSEIFNAGSGVETTVLELAEIIIDITQSKSKIVFNEARSWDHVKHRKSDIRKSEKLLGYKPCHDLKTNIAKTIDWLRAKT